MARVAQGAPTHPRAGARGWEEEEGGGGGGVSLPAHNPCPWHLPAADACGRTGSASRPSCKMSVLNHLLTTHYSLPSRPTCKVPQVFADEIDKCYPSIAEGGHATQVTLTLTLPLPLPLPL